MSKHIRDYGCSWCSARFDDLKAVKHHEKAKHRHNMPLDEDTRASLLLEKYAAEREGRSTGKVVRKYIKL